MEELIITKEMKDKINNYLGYELIKMSEVGHHLYDEAPGLGKIGVEGAEHGHVVTNKQLDSNGNVEWFKAANPSAKPGEIKSFHCKLTTVASKKAKILIASLFPEEASDPRFLEENRNTIRDLRQQLNIMKKLPRKARTKPSRPNIFRLEPKDMIWNGASYLYHEDEEREENVMLYGPNDMLI